jgi:hypothetical protein
MSGWKKRRTPAASSGAKNRPATSGAASARTSVSVRDVAQARRGRSKANPIADAACRSPLSSGASRSIRAWITARMRAGGDGSRTGPSSHGLPGDPAVRPDSCSSRTISSMKKGLPPARSRMRSVRVCIRGPVPRSFESSKSAGSSARQSSRTPSYCESVLHGGSYSGRNVCRRSVAVEAVRSKIPCSTRSLAASIQCMSS